ncbi:hypothetical protein [Thalassotalea sp. Y01]|uniref:hypothetical protein n=1 Tax=Thalassotalea sp. Y01 TaxID=2729613 RepID=UPI00145D1B07|nr:hypothetical protein [Thalassotalea sp. Y01]NMP17403.1 hypothetical protein [Thalassotalea sp. Y01]
MSFLNLFYIVLFCYAAVGALLLYSKKSKPSSQVGFSIAGHGVIMVGCSVNILALNAMVGLIIIGIGFYMHYLTKRNVSKK